VQFRVQATLYEKSVLACGAGVSIKPRVERGFASGTLGQRGLEEFQPAKRATARDPAASIARFAGSQFLLTTDPRVPLAKPRSTLGFMLTPAPQAKTEAEL